MRLSSAERFRRALTSQPVDRPPAWIMRQAGRYLPEYRAFRGEHAFLDCVHQPELAAEITLQPMRRFPFDAAIVFSDILLVLEALGLSVQFLAAGPRVAPTLDDAAVRLRETDVERDFACVRRTVELVRAQLGEERAVLGFAGAPFTLACYAIEGGGSKDFATTRRIMHAEPERFDGLLATLARVVGELLVLQVGAGVDAVQLFDTWGGTLAREDYQLRVAPHSAAIIRRVHEAGGRVILYVKDGAHLLDEALASGADCVSVDWRADMAAVAARCAGRCSVQGNLDPGALFAPDEEIRRRVRSIHAAVAGRTGHVFNLGHGILPTTPLAAVDAFLGAVAALGQGERA